MIQHGDELGKFGDRGIDVRPLPLQMSDAVSATLQRDLALEHLSSAGRDKRAAYENILWALINTKEFLFNH